MGKILEIVGTLTALIMGCALDSDSLIPYLFCMIGWALVLVGYLIERSVMHEGEKIIIDDCLRRGRGHFGKQCHAGRRAAR